MIATDQRRIFNEERVSFRRCGSKEDGWMIDGPKQKGRRIDRKPPLNFSSLIDRVLLPPPPRISFEGRLPKNGGGSIIPRGEWILSRGVWYVKCLLYKYLAPLFLRFHSMFSRRRSNMPLKGQQRLRLLRGGGGGGRYLSLSSPVSRSFFSILSRIFPRKLKSCLFLSFNNSWGLGRGSGGQGCELDLCELLFLRAREREEERVYVMWVPALSGRGWGFSGRCRGQSSREAKLEAIIRCPHGCPWIMLRETGLRELGN